MKDFDLQTYLCTSIERVGGLEGTEFIPDLLKQGDTTSSSALDCLDY